MTANLPLEKLSRLIAEKPELAAALKAVSSPAAAAELLYKAGQENGVAVDRDALAAYLTERTAAAANGKLSDADLDQVAGGGVGGAILASIVSLGLGCAGVSLVTAAGGGDCGKMLTSF